MALDYLHNHSNFDDLIQIIANEKDIEPVLAEKDYWIMHCLYGLRKQGLEFQLKGGTSLSKGFNIIHRFSEDIDIHIEPPAIMNVATGKNQDKEKHIKSRLEYYNWLSANISIEGATSVERDHVFDNEKMRSGGIRLHYPTERKPIKGVKEGVLLEAGFDNIAPNEPQTISSWAYDLGSIKVDVIDNRAKDILCYFPQYTFVEKLQTISTKYRNFIAKNEMPINFMRHYYDVYCLLQSKNVQNFIGTDKYHGYKAERFPKSDEKNLSKNQAFLLNDKDIRELFNKQYLDTKNLYYEGQIPLDEIILGIQIYLQKM